MRERPKGRDDDWAAAQRMGQQTLWVDLQVQQATQRGDFDNLPGADKPIPGLDRPHDPDWWVRQLIQREQITGVVCPRRDVGARGATGARLQDREARARCGAVGATVTR